MALSQRSRFIFAGAFFYVFFLLGWLPAEVVARLVAERSNDTVFLVDPKGTAWDGSAASVVVISPTDQVSIGEIRWHARLDRLVRGELAAVLHAADGSRTLVATTPTSIAFEDTSITLPASIIAVIVPALSIWRPAGELKLDTAHFTVGNDGTDGQATLLWQHAGTSLSRVQPLGDYSVSINGKKSATRFTVSTLSGPLEVSGQGVWRNRNDWQFNGQARATRAKRAALDDLLKLFSRAKDGDKYLLQFSSAGANK